MASGIYQIKNDVNGKIYVGKAKNLSTRWQQHKDVLEKGEHANKYLQIDYDEMGIDAFTYSILEKVPDCLNLDKVLFQKEREWGDKLDARGENGYNIANFYTKGHNNYKYNEVVQEVGLENAYCGVTVHEIMYILYHLNHECLSVYCLIRATLDSTCYDPDTLYKEDRNLGIWNISNLAEASNLAIKDLKICLNQLRDIKAIDWFIQQDSENLIYGFFNKYGLLNNSVEKAIHDKSERWKYTFNKCLMNKPKELLN